jgi:non-ribosomal peptide synthetase-like protein
MSIHESVLGAADARPSEPLSIAGAAKRQLMFAAFDLNAEARPNAPALTTVCGQRPGVVMTYGALREHATRFARYLRRRGVQDRDRVVIAMPRGFDRLAAIIGTMYAGAAYVPLDLGFPGDAIRANILDSGPRTVITMRSHAAELSPAAPLILFDEARFDVADESERPLEPGFSSVAEDDPAYIIYTSGSTGRPKGVLISHRSIANFIAAEGSILRLAPTDLVYKGFSPAFDMSIEETWTALSAGAALFFPDHADPVGGPGLAEVLELAGVTVLHCVPTLLATFERDVAGLRLINLGGEPCPPDLVRRFARPDRRIVNTYGPTETTVTATWAELKADEPVTIGRALPGYSTYVVDEDCHIVKQGVAGELCIAGSGVALGYLNRPELTAEKFVHITDPSAGCPIRAYRSGDRARLDEAGRLVYLARLDGQVKIRGYRVELGEIEQRLQQDPAIVQAVVSLHRDALGIDQIVAYVLPRVETSLDLGAVHTRLRAGLPPHMVPAGYMLVKEFPTLVSGKVDRKHLPPPDALLVPPRPRIEPANNFERLVHDAWAKAFGQPSISVEDDFFADLGGHSLRAAVMVSELRKDPRTRGIAMDAVYRHRTIRTLAAALATAPFAEAPVIAPQARPAVPRHRLIACALAQALVLPLILAIAALPIFGGYCVFELTARLGLAAQFVFAALAFILAPALQMGIAIIAKWTIIGRYREGAVPLWGVYYFRWWIVRRLVTIADIVSLGATPVLLAFYRALGARIGRGAMIGQTLFDAFDLISIGDGAQLASGVRLASAGVEDDRLVFGRVAIGDDASIQAGSLIGRGAVVGCGAEIGTLTMIGEGVAVPAGELWEGSPARRVGNARPPATAAKLGPRERLAVRTLVSLLAFLMPMLSIFLPATVVMWRYGLLNPTLGLLAAAPLAALSYVLIVVIEVAALKWSLLGRVKGQCYRVDSYTFLRFWLAEQAVAVGLVTLHGIFATLYVRPYFRLLGARLGRNAEISTAVGVLHDLVVIEHGSFLADGVVFGPPHIRGGVVTIAPTSIGVRSFVGNSAVIPSGTALADNTLVGVLSVPPQGESQRRAGTTWFGSPAFELPRREVFARDDAHTFQPSPRLVAARLSIEAIRILAPSAIALVVAISAFDAAYALIAAHHADVAGWALGYLVGIAIIAGGALAVSLAVKWAVIGRYRATVEPLWSLFVWRTELVTTIYESVAVPQLLAHLRGTVFLNLTLRAFGAKIGRGVFTNTTDMTEHDLVSVGDGAALNEDCGLQTHLFEDRIMKVAPLTVGPQAVVGEISIVLYHAALEPAARLGDLSVLMKADTRSA